MSKIDNEQLLSVISALLLQKMDVEKMTFTEKEFDDIIKNTKGVNVEVNKTDKTITIKIMENDTTKDNLSELLKNLTNLIKEM